MTPSADTNRYKNHRFPGEIISHGIWLYYRFSLSYRDVQELLMERGIDVSHESIRKWCGKFGQDYANQLRRRRPQPGDKWHLDEVFLTIHGERYYLWRAVDQDDNVLDVLVQSRRNKKAAKKFFRKLLKGLAMAMPASTGSPQTGRWQRHGAHQGRAPRASFTSRMGSGCIPMAARWWPTERTTVFRSFRPMASF